MALRTSTMKSEPGWSAVSTSTLGEGSRSWGITAAVAERAASCCCAGAGFEAATNAAAPPTVPFRKFRRPTEGFLSLALGGLAIAPRFLQALYIISLIFRVSKPYSGVGARVGQTSVYLAFSATCWKRVCLDIIARNC